LLQKEKFGEFSFLQQMNFIPGLLKIIKSEKSTGMEHDTFFNLLKQDFIETKSAP
jgi:hypothetical protein